MFEFKLSGTQPLNVLCLGAHCDDIEIGCGGTLLKLFQGERPVCCSWVTFCSTPPRKKEAEQSAAAFLTNADSHQVMIHSFRDGYLPWQGDKVKDEFEKLKAFEPPDVIFTHWRDDYHQDHRVLSELTLNTFRNHLILEYEIPKYDGDLGRPNVFVPLSETTCRNKVDLLREKFPSQNQKKWFTDDLFLSLLRLRGMECNAQSGYAEAFHGRKLIVDLG